MFFLDPPPQSVSKNNDRPVDDLKRDYEPATDPPIGIEKISRPAETYTPTEDGKSNCWSRSFYYHIVFITIAPAFPLSPPHIHYLSS